MLNKVQIIGYLGRDPDTRYMQDGTPVSQFSVATTEAWTSNGVKNERTEWHSVIAYAKLAEICGQYLRKGSQVYIEGKIRSRKYTGKDGVERTAYEIVAVELKMLGGKNQAASQSSDAPF